MEISIKGAGLSVLEKLNGLKSSTSEDKNYMMIWKKRLISLS